MGQRITVGIREPGVPQLKNLHSVFLLALKTLYRFQKNSGVTSAVWFDHAAVHCELLSGTIRTGLRFLRRSLCLLVRAFGFFGCILYSVTSLLGGTFRSAHGFIHEVFTLVNKVRQLAAQ